MEFVKERMGDHHEGIGTLVHANEYQSIRPAKRRDARAIHALIRRGVEAEELVGRSRADIERSVEDFYLFEVDRDPVACVALHRYAAENDAELACLYVDARFENRGIGARLVQYAESVARGWGARRLFCLSTQAFNFFKGACANRSCLRAFASDNPAPNMALISTVLQQTFMRQMADLMTA